MDKVSRKLDIASQALARLQEVLALPVDEVVRDSAILRFTLATETVWKAARSVIVDQMGAERLNSASPKAMVRESQIAGFLTEEQAEAAMRMMNDRNLTVHTYDEEKAEELFSRLPAHAALIESWISAMQSAITRP
ncbi:nucleotidyltransferase substrate binding protein, HI0074 family [Azospirillum oryzae]|uniref:Nucleotidyltransferase substrate binding protein, HI0074 family n=1 Tax=Azospirillum oryzae TaxID=286727 RepID=A0A1X7GY50_9PROT|nr:nucleotidyltransferase substrate binding protein [Azospirillum oryzae]SMF75771.1 nucleotidyltransferase substrate binding protein, HI0074 family [Azospirillum oryzae]